MKTYLAEFLGTCLLIMVVVGSGIMGESLASGNLAVALLANAIATGAGLYVLINIFGPISGAHFNPVVSLWTWSNKQLSTKSFAFYIAAQVVGGLVGIFLTHFIFELPILQLSTHSRDGVPQMASEIIATFGLLLTICGFSQSKPEQTATGVALYITCAYWFTSSTSFANPAVTIARSLTNTFAGIAPHSSPLYICAQFIGFGFFMIAWRFLKTRPA